MLIFDSSTLILLAKIELLSEIVHSLPIVISEKVKEESTKKRELFDAKLILDKIKSGKIKVEKIGMKSIAGKIKRDFNLGEGEVESIMLYKEGKGKLLATDDKPTIKACRILGVPVVTAPDFLVRSYEKKKLSRKIALEKLNKLEKYGRYSPRIIEDVKHRIEGD